MLMRYLQFIKESSAEPKLGCVMISLKFDNWNDILDKIDDSDVFLRNDGPCGKCKSPHITLLYGFHSGVTIDEIKNCFEGVSANDIELVVDGVSTFENKEFDVVKLGIKESSMLIELNKRLLNLPNSNEFPEYKPHITIAYVKKGLGQKYVDKNYTSIIRDIHHISYTNDHKSYKFDI